MQIILDVWFISILILIIGAVCGVRNGIRKFIHCVLPVFTQSYWYITCYVLLLSLVVSMVYVKIFRRFITIPTVNVIVKFWSEIVGRYGKKN